ncbi:MAG TPA: CheR family methyltransferase [Candidatus Brocadiia bacterium]|nr:CheR family methyltransferase [Candidatus Brocadiia bacterium]
MTAGAASVAALLTERIGLEPASIGLDAVARAVERRMKALDHSDPGAYLRLAESSPQEWARLVEEVVVPETWFFRDWEPFARLAAYAAGQWPGLGHDRLFRVLSVPCATGEEPYSVAMALLDAGLPAERFEVDAVDISEDSLAKARRAVYGRNAFRGARLDFRDRHFVPLPDETWQLKPAARRPVKFIQANLLSPGFLHDRPPYDAVLCRNLLIYFDESARDRAFKTLDRLLAPDGLLFSGHAEAVLVMRAGFAPMPWRGSFAYRRAPAQPAPCAAPPKAAASSAPKAPAFARPSAAVAATPSPLCEPRGDPPAPLPPPPLEQVARLADEGKLDEALSLCRRETHRPDAVAAAWRWQGIILEAMGERGAAEGCYEKALYLDPKDQESMAHLALVLELRGETERAAVLRRRRERLEAGVSGRAQL